MTDVQRGSEQEISRCILKLAGLTASVLEPCYRESFCRGRKNPERISPQGGFTLQRRNDFLRVTLFRRDAVELS